ncbi:hypothetical protein LEP1GSC191_3992 [Leptospira borgpetersenii serovar Mini str. 201000851]|nr:hypothetical protein LEP1GSC191_3992 [Leptospira borgpetersenii serovar Mini str. 201000851]
MFKTCRKTVEFSIHNPCPEIFLLKKRLKPDFRSPFPGGDCEKLSPLKNEFSMTAFSFWTNPFQKDSENYYSSQNPKKNISKGSASF